MTTPTTEQLAFKLGQLRKTAPQEIGGRVADVIPLIEELIELRATLKRQEEHGKIMHAAVQTNGYEWLHEAVTRVVAERDALQATLATADPFYTIKAPGGPQGEFPAYVIHTHLSPDEPEAIASFLHTENTMLAIANMGRSSRGEAPHCAESWEVWEAKGYKVVEVLLLEVKRPPALSPS